MYNNHATKKHMPKVSAKHSPKDTRCLYCGKKFTSKGVYEHERHHCQMNPHRKKRSWGKVKCRVCGKMYHAAGLRTHMATQHPLEYAKEKAHNRPSSRAAMRRRVARRAEREEQRRRDVSRSPSPRQSSSRPIAPSPKDTKQSRNTESRAMQDIQREMRRASAAD